MNKREFAARRRPAWQRFEALLAGLDEGRTSRLTAAETTEFSRLFREVCFDLSLVRSRDWGVVLSSYLNDLVSRGHNAFYSAPPGKLSRLARFLAFEFPRTFRRNAGYFYVAAALFFVPFFVAWAVVQADPSAARRVVPAKSLEQMNEMYSAEGFKKVDGSAEKNGASQRGRSDDFGEQRSAMFGFYIKNNVSIAFQVFAQGILFGVGTVYTLLSNGIGIGTIFGYIISQGNGSRLLSFAVSHGSFELTAIAVSGGAGLMLGDALIHPGQRTRLESLRHRGLEAIQIACGAGAMLVIAAIIEAFWSPASIPQAVKYSVGGALWVLVALYLGTAGRWERPR